MPVAYSYIRFSTPEQLKGDSLRRQTELSAEYAANHGLTLDTSLHLHDLGLSAFDNSNLARGSLGGFLKAVEQGRITPGSYLLVESLDRLSRAHVMDALHVFLSILKQGITIVTLADGMVYRHDTSDVSSLIISISIMARAHEESLTKSRRIKAAWSNKRANLSEKKLTAQCPKWMQLNQSRTAFEFIPERAKIVNEILDSAKVGMGQALIAKKLNERGVPPFSSHGKGWHSSYIQKILGNTALYGEFQPGIFENGKAIPYGDPVPNYYPALISKEDFFLIQDRRTHRAFGGAKAKKGSSVPNLLSGLVKCGYCGNAMVMAGKTGKRIRTDDIAEVKRPSIKVLVCDGGRRGLGCYAVQWDYKDFEKSFLTFCRGLELGKMLTSLSTDTAAKSAEAAISERLQAANAEIAQTDTRLKRLVDAIESGSPPSTLVERVRSYELDLISLKDLKKRLEAELHTAESTSRELELAAESMRALIAQMESLESESLFTVRVALADHIRRYIEVVKVFPAGQLRSEAVIQQVRDKLTDAGFSESEIEEHMRERYYSEPPRQGRGKRGRYASRKDISRLFLIQAKNGVYTTVYPDFDDPSKLVFGTEIEPPERGGYRMLQSGSNDSFKPFVDSEVS